MRGYFLLLLAGILFSAVCVAENQTTISVSTLEEFMGALGSDRTIQLAAGTYSLQELKSAESDTVRFASVFDGSELVLKNVSNLVIQGSKDQITEIVTDSTYAEVMVFRNVSNIIIKDITFKHSVPGDCNSGVLTFENAKDIQLKRVLLDGSGTTGLTLTNAEAVSINSVKIQNCSQSIASFQYAKNVQINDSHFIKNGGGLDIRASAGVEITRTVIESNSGYDSLIRLSGGSELDVKDSVIKNNQFSVLCNREELLRVEGGSIINSGGFESRWQVLAPQILQLGTFHGDEVWARNGEEWFGLYETDAGWRLNKANITVSPQHDALLDSKPDQLSGKRVGVAEESSAPLLFMRGIKGLTEGIVDSITLNERNPCNANNCGIGLYPGRKFYISLGKDQYALVASGESYLTEPLGESQYRRLLLKNYELHLERYVDGKNIFPMLFSAEFIDDDAGVPGVLWAGDIDRDGVLDLLLSTSTHYNVSATTLYLSSLSDSGLIPVEAAHFSSAGC